MPGHANSAYCDCPGFADSRGSEINIANAINIRKVLQQASGVKAVFLTSYGRFFDDFFDDRGSGVKALQNMCGKMFGGGDDGVENLRRHQNSVLLGITKAPFSEGGELITREDIVEHLEESGDIAKILAKRVFLFDPLDRCTDNSSFWYLEQLRTEIARLDTIPKNATLDLFKTALDNDDHRHLLETARLLKSSMVDAIEKNNRPKLGQYWELFQRLHIIEHPEIEKLEGEVLTEINFGLLNLAQEFNNNIYNLEFEKAQNMIDRISRIIFRLPGAQISLQADPNHLKDVLKDAKKRQNDRQALQQSVNDLIIAIQEAEEILKRERNKKKKWFW